MKPGFRYVVLPMGLSVERRYSAALYTCGISAARASPTRSLAATASDFISRPRGWLRRVSSIARSRVSFSPGCRVSSAATGREVAIVSRQPANTILARLVSICIISLQYSLGFRNYTGAFIGLRLLLQYIDDL